MTSSSKGRVQEWSPETVRMFVSESSGGSPDVREHKNREFQADESTGKPGQPADKGTAEAVKPREVRESIEVLEARIEAERILAEARAEAESIKKLAEAEGFRKGEAEGRRKGLEQSEQRLNASIREQKEQSAKEIAGALINIEETKERYLKAYLNELRDCAITVAEKVIHTSLKSSGDIIKRMIVFETEKLKKTAWIKIYLEKTDYDMVMEADANLVAELSRISDSIKFVVMEEDGRGSLIIETPEEILDIGVETQIDNIREMAQTVRF